MRAILCGTAGWLVGTKAGFWEPEGREEEEAETTARGCEGVWTREVLAWDDIVGRERDRAVKQEDERHCAVDIGGVG